MFTWIANNAATLIAMTAVLIVIGIAVFSLIKDKKNNKGGCTGNCASCRMGCSYCKSKK